MDRLFLKSLGVEHTVFPKVMGGDIRRHVVWP